MKKLSKSVIYIFACIVLFAGGFWCYGKIGFPKEVEQIRREREKRISVRNEILATEVHKRNMSDEDIKFLDEHLLGAWEFSERIVPLEQEYDGSLGISGQGLEEMKNIIITVQDATDYYKIRPEHYDKDSFSNPTDVFLFNLYMGFSYGADVECYQLERNVDEGRLGLRHIISWEGDCEEYMTAFPGECELVHVTYGLSYDTKENPVLLPEIYPADSLYIDPDDYDTIYLDFCGLWKMKRVSWEKYCMPGNSLDLESE